jgi:hypothetical protein
MNNRQASALAETINSEETSRNKWIKKNIYWLQHKYPDRYGYPPRPHHQQQQVPLASEYGPTQEIRSRSHHVQQVPRYTLQPKYYKKPRAQSARTSRDSRRKGMMSEKEIREPAYDPHQRPVMQIFTENIGKSTWYGGRRSDIDGVHRRFLASSLGYGNTHRNFQQYLTRAPREDIVYEYPKY